MDAFGIFCDTEVIIERVMNAGSYSGDTEYEEVCRVNADIQPNSGGGAQKEYGIFRDARLVMYCEDNGHIKDGMRAVISGRRYVVTGTEHRSLGIKAYLREDVK